MVHTKQWTLNRFTLLMLALLLAIWAGGSAIPLHAQAQNTTGQQVVDIRPSQDTFIRAREPDTNFSASPSLELHTTLSAEVEQILLQFDLESLPSGAIIQQAQLRLYQREASGSLSLRIDRITSEWDAATVTWESSPDASTYYASLPNPSSVDSYVTWDVTELVTEWLETPEIVPNLGMLLALNHLQQPATRTFDSSRGEQAPHLHILYTAPDTGIPAGAATDELDPQCHLNNERYNDGAIFSFRDGSGQVNGELYLIHNESDLFVCVTSYGESNRFFGVYLDQARSQAENLPTVPAREQILLRIDGANQTTSAWRGTDNPDIPYAEDETITGWEAVIEPSDVSFDVQSAEFRIPRSLLGPQGQCGASFGIAVYHQPAAENENGTLYGWPRAQSPNDPSTWAGVLLDNADCPIRVICTTTELPCTPAGDVQLFNAGSGALYTVDEDGYVQDRPGIADGDRLWARLPVTVSPDLPYVVYYTSGAPQTVGIEEFVTAPEGEMTLWIDPATPLMTYDLEMSSQWRIEDHPAYATWLEENLHAASAYLYHFTNGQIAIGEMTIRQDWEGWDEANIRLHASNHMRPDATLGGINKTPLLDPDNDLLPVDVEGDIIYWPGKIRIGASWNRYHLPGTPSDLDVDTSQDWAMVFAHELGHYLLYLLDTYFRVGPNNTIVNVYSCEGSAMGWVYFPENHAFVADPGHWETNCRHTYGNDLLNRAEWATITRFFPWLVSPAPNTPPATFALPAGITGVTLIPAQDDPGGAVNQLVELLYQDAESASPEARALIFRNDRIIDQGKPALGATQIELTGGQEGDRLCLIDINPPPTRPNSPRHQFGCAALVAGDNTLALHKDPSWAPVILLTPVTTQSLTISVTQPANVPLKARLYPEDSAGFVEIELEPQARPRDLAGTFNLDAPATSAFVQVFADEPDLPGTQRRNAIIDYGANGGGLPGPTSSFGHGPVVASSDGRALFLLTENVTLGPGEFIAWQSMIGHPPLRFDQEIVGQPYRLIAMPPELVDAGVVSIRFPPFGTIQAAQATPTQLEGFALHFWTGTAWTPLPTDFVEDPNGDTIASAASQGAGLYALLAPRDDAAPPLLVPYIERKP